MVHAVSIAIDGPAGAGKSTVAKKLAKRLGFLYIDTGAMYRAVTLQAMREGISCDDDDALTALAGRVNISLVTGYDGGLQVLLDDVDVTEAIRNQEVNRNVSLVARAPGVRKRLAALQRAMAVNGGVVMEGRDIGTVVLPQAEFKFFLTASPEERGKRRLKDLRAKGYRLDQQQVVKEIGERDRIDSEREVDPLKPAPGAIVIDNSFLSAEQVVNLITDTIFSKGKKQCFTGLPGQFAGRSWF